MSVFEAVAIVRDQLEAINVLEERMVKSSARDQLEYLVEAVRRYAYFAERDAERRSYYGYIHRVHEKVLRVVENDGHKDKYIAYLTDERRYLRGELNRLSRRHSSSSPRTYPPRPLSKRPASPTQSQLRSEDGEVFDGYRASKRPRQESSLRPMERSQQWNLHGKPEYTHPRIPC
ncbi:unnamed protein product [Aphanomyces euteiches]